MPRPNYYVLLPNGNCISMYIKNLKAAKQVLLDMNERVRLIKIKRR